MSKSDPLSSLVSVTPSDSVDLSRVSRALYVGTTGNLRVTMESQADGSSVTLANVPVGWHPLQVKRVWSTNTTASDIAAGW